MTRPDGLPFQRVALVLQGGGALGAYQGGVVQGLHEAGIGCDWIAGVSIGALNAALIAGNPPERRMARLREFWETVCKPAFLQATPSVFESAVEPLGGAARQWLNGVQAWRALTEGQKGFFRPRGPMAWWPSDDPSQVSLYDTAPLRATLESLVDFDLLNDGPTRVSVLAVDVESGNLEVFDSAHQRLGPEHFMASGALPPGFPPVRIGLRWFWDGGLLSNTPLSVVLCDEPRRDTLVFQVDLWSAKGPMPRHLLDAQERAKDIQFSSRTRQITDRLREEHQERELLKSLLALIPEDRREHEPTCRALQRRLQVARVAVLHLIYQDKEWDGLAKDYEFGALTMRNHWDSGLEDVRRTLAHRDWLRLPPEEHPFVTHDVHRRRSEGG